MGLYERWVHACPLVYTSPNAPRVANILGTLFLASLSGCRRSSHVNGPRGDGISTGLLGTAKFLGHLDGEKNGKQTSIRVEQIGAFAGRLEH